MSMEKVHENLIKVTHYEEWGKLPNPFVFNDGTPLKNPEEWGKRREEIFTTAVELQYGTIPPSPEVLEISRLNYNANFPTGYRITAGTKQQTLSFVMRLFLPEGDGPFPLVVDGDLCFKGPFHQNFVKTFTDRGIGVVLFDRTELVPDPANSGIGRVGPLYEIYPDYTFGSIAAWAWGYSRCVDALEKCNFRDKIDFNYIAFTGHSRGGKTAMLAGVLDERAFIVNPNETNAGACSCYRSRMRAITEDGEEKESETLEMLVRRFPEWMGPDLKNYVGKEADLPFDEHFLKAMVAPRVLLVGEAASDIWTNPIGTWQTTLAAKEVFRFLGVEDRLLWYFRKGYHGHKIEDLEMLADTISYFRNETPLADGYFITPFNPVEKMFDWHCPVTEKEK